MKYFVVIHYLGLLLFGVHMGSATSTKVGNDVVDARQAFSEEFPFIVTTVYKDNLLEKSHYKNTGYGCIGVIINERTILTSRMTPATYPVPKYELGVVADGNLICYADIDPKSVIPVDSVVLNKNYEQTKSSKHSFTWYTEWNLALLILKDDIHYTSNVQPVRLPAQPPSVGDKAVYVAAYPVHKNATVSSELSIIDQSMVQSKTDDYTWKYGILGTPFSGKGSAVFSLSNYPLISNGTLIGYGITSFYPGDDWTNGIIVCMNSTSTSDWIKTNSYV